MARQNSINRATQDLTIDPGASGDSFVQFDINTTNEFRIGVDDDAADAFKISQGNALGTTDTFVMSAAGERTMPLQPAFSAYLGTGDLNVTGNGTVYRLGQGNALTEIFDQGGDFNTNGTFTAPITGRFFVNGGFLIQQAGGTTALSSYIITSNRTWYCLSLNPSAALEGGTTYQAVIAAFVDMDAADTATLNVVATGIGADTADIFGGATSPRSYFAGELAC